MTRKDYVLAAKLVGAVEDDTARGIVIAVLLRLFGQDNERFSAERFIAAMNKEHLALYHTA